MKMGTVISVLSSIALAPCCEGFSGIVFPFNSNKLKDTQNAIEYGNSNAIGHGSKDTLPNGRNIDTSKSGNIDYILKAAVRKLFQNYIHKQIQSRFFCFNENSHFYG